MDWLELPWLKSHDLFDIQYHCGFWWFILCWCYCIYLITGVSDWQLVNSLPSNGHQCVNSTSYPSNQEKELLNGQCEITGFLIFHLWNEKFKNILKHAYDDVTPWHMYFDVDQIYTYIIYFKNMQQINGVIRKWKKKDITFTGMQLLIQYDIKWINPKGF